MFAFGPPAFIKAAITLTPSPENKLRISREKIVTRYSTSKHKNPVFGGTAVVHPDRVGKCASPVLISATFLAPVSGGGVVVGDGAWVQVVNPMHASAMITPTRVFVRFIRSPFSGWSPH